jgi:hypothetical protein
MFKGPFRNTRNLKSDCWVALRIGFAPTASMLFGMPPHGPKAGSWHFTPLRGLCHGLDLCPTQTSCQAASSVQKKRQHSTGSNTPRAAVSYSCGSRSDTQAPAFQKNHTGCLLWKRCEKSP